MVEGGYFSRGPPIATANDLAPAPCWGFRCTRECVFVCVRLQQLRPCGVVLMAQSPKRRPPIEVVKVGVGSGGGAIQECDAIKYDGKLWLVPQWLDEPGS